MKLQIYGYEATETEKDFSLYPSVSIGIVVKNNYHEEQIIVLNEEHPERMSLIQLDELIADCEESKKHSFTYLKKGSSTLYREYKLNSFFIDKTIKIDNLEYSVINHINDVDNGIHTVHIDKQVSVKQMNGEQLKEAKKNVHSKIDDVIKYLDECKSNLTEEGRIAYGHKEGGSDQDTSSGELLGIEKEWIHLLLIIMAVPSLCLIVFLVLYLIFIN
ncbi:hypothetical protein ACI2JA_03385 [Alkalihalobacillus sp. NPDC078783]